jgi:hydrogenase expression/formation protein HypC
MCLGIPGRVAATYREHDVLMGKVQFGGISRRVCLEHVPDVRVDDYVLVHVGFALSKIDEEEARQVFTFLEAMNQLDEWATADEEGPRPVGTTPVEGGAHPSGALPPVRGPDASHSR